MLDLRLPVGIFFLLIGAILAVDGLLHPVHSPGVELVLNRDWGIFLVVFGALMTGFGGKAQRHLNSADGAEKPPHEPH
jgi:hypothetical protein